MSFAHEVFRAKIATEWSLGVATLVMRTHVEEQVALQREALATLRAHEWTFTGMTAHVIYEMFLRNSKGKAGGKKRGKREKMISNVVRVNTRLDDGYVVVSFSHGTLSGF